MPRGCFGTCHQVKDRCLCVCLFERNERDRSPASPGGNVSSRAVSVSCGLQRDFVSTDRPANGFALPDLLVLPSPGLINVPGVVVRGTTLRLLELLGLSLSIHKRQWQAQRVEHVRKAIDLRALLCFAAPTWCGSAGCAVPPAGKSAPPDRPRFGGLSRRHDVPNPTAAAATWY